jgi:hypothetical protein
MGEAQARENGSRTVKVPGHPLQFAMCGDAYVANSQDMTNEEIQAVAGPRNRHSVVKRFEHCPTCQQQTPCAVLRRHLKRVS